MNCKKITYIIIAVVILIILYLALSNNHKEIEHYRPYHRYFGWHHGVRPAYRYPSEVYYAPYPAVLV